MKMGGERKKIMIKVREKMTRRRDIHVRKAVRDDGLNEKEAVLRSSDEPGKKSIEVEPGR